MRARLLAGDERRLSLQAGLVRDLAATTFTRLRANDIVFIDSSRVMKLGNDVSVPLNEVLPRLGVERSGAFRLLLTDSSRYECCCARTTRSERGSGRSGRHAGIPRPALWSSARGEQRGQLLV